MASILSVSRNEVKLLCYKRIFFSNEKTYSGKVYDAFNSLYPGLIDEINRLRDDINIARELQKIESNIFVNNISNLDFKMMLRHDAIFVYEEDYDLIKEYVIAEFNKIGLKATIK
jgi:hypothetical protein